MSKVITQDNEQILQIYNRLKETLMRLESILKDNTPTLNGHRYMNDSELANYLKVSRRTLQEYRNNGILRHSCISPWQYNHVIQRLWTL